MKPDRVFSLLGLATKAGKVVSGEFSTEKAIKSGKAFLVIVAEDASANTKKAFSDSCSYYQVPIAIYGTKETLGHGIGKQMRASVAVIDANFGREIAKKIEMQNNMEV
ncbi:MAG: ribosomal L7Ae/L30e/S12e/Gadd45 family protein [Bacteroides sp.]|nr:ribosomal L7Ae/L30e/S12e/Gadd45 family protein [Bacteroides sp.]MCM1549302.1 ribosomal L7Ae/L30e/S12e/Gadd45 family protein [Clostridium sp.]